MDSREELQALRRLAELEAKAGTVPPSLAETEAQPVSDGITATRQSLFPSGRSTVTGMTPSEAQATAELGMRDLTEASRQSAAASMRYGVPIAAGVGAAMAAPVTLPAIGLGALISGTGAATGYLGDYLAQSIELAGKEGEPSQREALAAGIRSGVPVKFAGKFTPRFLFNSAAMLSANEGAEIIEKGNDYSVPTTKAEAAIRWGLPIGMATAVSKVGQVANRATAADVNIQQIAKERFGGSAMVGEVLPELSALEARQFLTGNKIAHKLLEETDANFGDAILRAFPDSPETGKIGRYLLGAKEQLGQVESRITAAKKELESAQEQMQVAMLDASPTKMIAAKKRAAEAALKITSEGLVKDTIANVAFGKNDMAVSAVSLGNRAAKLGNIMKEVAGEEGVIKRNIDAIYTDAGIGPNTPVADWSSVRASIVSQSKRGGFFEGKELRDDTLKSIGKYFQDRGGVLSLEQYRNIQSSIADEMVSKGMKPDRAEAIAGRIYQAIRQSSDKYLSKTLPPAQFESWKRGQALSAQNFALRETDAVKLLQEGNVDGFYDKVLKEGWGKTAESFDNYAKFIASTGAASGPEGAKAALDAANAFKIQVNRLLGQTVLSRSTTERIGTGQDMLSSLVDPRALAREVDTLRAKGFKNVADLGLGTPEQIKAMAKIASPGTPGGITTDQMKAFLDAAPIIGIPRATAEARYVSALRDSLLTEGTPQAKRKVLEARRYMNEAKLTEERYNIVSQALDNDPIVRLLRDPGFSLPKSVTQSAQFNKHLLTLEPETAKAFAQNLQAAGKSGDLDTIRKALSYDVMRQFDSVGAGPQRVNMQKMVDSFLRPGDTASTNRNKVLRELIGEEGFSNLKDNFILPMRRLLDTAEGIAPKSIGSGQSGMLYLRQGVQAGEFRLAGIISPRVVLDLIGRGRYNTAYTLYINPKTAPIFKRAAWDVDKAINNTPALGTALKLAAEQDAQDSR
jgi:hypothetical protein